MNNCPIHEHIALSFSNLGIKYQKARYLIEEQSKKDPVTKPHQSLRAGYNILLDVIKGVQTIMRSSLAQNYLPTLAPKIIAIVGGLWAEIGVVNMAMEEPNCEQNLRMGLEHLEKATSSPEHVIPLINTYNSLGLVYSQRDNFVLAREYLVKAESVYIEFKKDINCKPVEMSSVFSIAVPITDNEHTSAKKKMETLHTLTLFYLAQVYEKLDDSLKSAGYLHTTLKRQLESKEYDAIEWALNAATLSQYFTEKKKFSVARHHLSAASYVLVGHERVLQTKIDCSKEELDAMYETFHHRKADVARCWSKYGMLLLNYSMDRLMADEVKKEEETHVPCEDQHDMMWFSSMNLEIFEEQITDTYVLVFDDARKVFINAQLYINQAKEYYTLENHASDYAELVRDHGELFRLLKFFEPDEKRQCCMNKRRIDLIEEVLKQLNPQYYTNICQQLWYDAAQAYGEILEVKIENLQSDDANKSPHALHKINTLTEESIRCYNSFLQTVKNTSTNELPKDLPENVLLATLRAQFHIGRLSYKLLSSDTEAQIANIQQSLNAYNYVAEYCSTHEDAAKLMTLELSVIKSMVLLLPLKIKKLRRQKQ